MALVVPWDETLPANTDSLTDGDDKIRDFKKAVRERMNNGGIKWEPAGGASTDQDAGKLTCGVQGTTGILTLIENEAEVVICTVRDGTDAGGVKEYEFGDGIAGSEAYRVVADVVAGNREHTLVIPLPTITTGRIPGIYFHNDTSDVITIVSADLYANTGPTSTALDVDIHLHSTGWSDLSSGGVSIVASPPVISIAASAGAPARAAAPVTTFSDPTLAVGEVLAFEVDTLSTADDIVLFLKIKRVI